MKYIGDYKENLIVILFSVLILIWFYKSNKNIKNYTPKWVIIFDKYKIFIYLIILFFYILNCFDIVNNINNINMKIPMSVNKKYKMKVYTEPPNFN
jgi:uncharacterized membrane protein